jgi:hypothetical protein
MINSRFTAVLAAMLFTPILSFAADDAITLRAGNELTVQLITTLNSKTNDAGDMWTGKVEVPIFGEGREILPEGSTVDGHITYVKDPSETKGKSKGEMRLIVDSISTPDRSKYNMETSLENTQTAKGKDKADEGTGIMAALARKFSKKGKDIVLPQGTEVTFVISRDTTAKKVVAQSGASSN